MPEIDIEEIYCPLIRDNCKKTCILYHTEYLSGNFKSCLIKNALVKYLVAD